MKDVMFAIISTAFFFMVAYVCLLHSGYLFQRREVQALVALSGQQDLFGAMAEASNRR